MVVPGIWSLLKAWRCWIRWALNSCAMSRRAKTIYITEKGQLFTRQCADNPVSNPCLFEYVYLLAFPLSTDLRLQRSCERAQT
ncbi:hypothetical protein KCP71_14730 [Salmonella enterica subsp. enterica]|nr:hypothetical protein KCP71_14730 [Salmonella enterica subsp. enterica]